MSLYQHKPPDAGSGASVHDGRRTARTRCVDRVAGEARAPENGVRAARPGGCPGRVAVQRAITELRSGRPVLILGRTPMVVAGAEAADARDIASLTFLAGSHEPVGSPRTALILSAARLRWLGQRDRVLPGRVDLDGVDETRLSALVSDPEARLDGPAHAACATETAALELARLAFLLPAMIRTACSPDAARDVGIMPVDEEAVGSYAVDHGARFAIVGRTSCALDGASEAEFVVFRGDEGQRDQIAVVVGKPDLGRPVRVRVHSACLTGDLFGSLRCDCGDQLRGSVGSMAAAGGGILLYLDHEGRGIGLANKMRAYNLQAHGLDTFAADEALGFERDHRRYEFAAAMLRGLGVSSVSLLTNNPMKALALEAAGVRIAEIRRIHGRVTAHNVRYLAAKREITHHNL